MDNPKYNDGGGLWDNSGLCDTLVNDLNCLMRCAVSGQYVQMCAVITGMAQKIVNLKKGIAADLESKDHIIEELKRANNALIEEKTGLSVDRGSDNGTD